MLTKNISKMFNVMNDDKIKLVSNNNHNSKMLFLPKNDTSSYSQPVSVTQVNPD